MPRKKLSDLPAIEVGPTGYGITAFDGDAPPPPEISPSWKLSTVSVKVATTRKRKLPTKPAKRKIVLLLNRLSKQSDLKALSLEEICRLLDKAGAGVEPTWAGTGTWVSAYESSSKGVK